VDVFDIDLIGIEAGVGRKTRDLWEREVQGELSDCSAHSLVPLPGHHHPSSPFKVSLSL
jgi:hypothetical protein